MQRGERKSIVLLNNGKISEIPSPLNCEEGMVVTISYNKRIITLISLLSCAALLCAFLVLRSVYYNPFGYVQFNYGNAAVELAYNRFQRIFAVRPLNQLAVEPVATLSLNNTGIEAAYEKIMLSFTRSPSFPEQNQVLVRIAQDNLAGAKKIEQNLSLLSHPLAAVSFELYTHELYRDIMTAGHHNPIVSPPQNSVPQMYRWWNRNQNMRGRRNCWSW
jgi:hypothetical protein